MDVLVKLYLGVLVFFDFLVNVLIENIDIEIDDWMYVVFMCFIGGMIGDSKCVKYLIDNILGCCDSFLIFLDLDFFDGCCMLYIVFISYGSGMMFLLVLFSGGCMVIMNEFSLENWCCYI